VKVKTYSPTLMVKTFLKTKSIAKREKGTVTPQIL
jgi:hypothetical protein